MPTSALDEFSGIAIGEIDECRMSLFAMFHLLKRRSYGPAQLIPALNELEAMARRHASSVMYFTELLTESQQSGSMVEPWRGVMATTLREAADVLGGIGDTFSGHQRLGARARLDLESQVMDFGGRSECLHDVVRAVIAAATTRTRACELTDVMTSGGRSIKDYADGEVSLWLLDEAHPVELIPEVWRLVLQQQLWWLHDNGHNEMVVLRKENDCLRVLARSNCDLAMLGQSTIERVRLPLRRRMPYEKVVAETLTKHIGIDVERRPGEVVMRRRQLPVGEAPLAASASLS